MCVVGEVKRMVRTRVGRIQVAQKGINLCVTFVLDSILLHEIHHRRTLSKLHHVDPQHASHSPTMRPVLTAAGLQDVPTELCGFQETEINCMKNIDIYFRNLLFLDYAHSARAGLES